MKRLSHPIRAIREPFGTAGLIVACVALVAALGGTAFAAAKLNGTQKKEVEKIAKKYAGKPGAAGTNGSNGSAGAKGDTGAAGTNGTGATTESFSGSKTVGSVTCTEGGVVIKSGSPETIACNGKKGTNGINGAPGSPWAVGGVLPPEQTETGSWSLGGKSPIGLVYPLIASFSIPLEAPLGIGNVHFVTAEEWKNENGHTPPAACLGTAEEPKATPENLCIYEGKMVEVTVDSFLKPGANPVGLGASTTGTVGLFTTQSEEYAGYGTWAVTAPAET